MNSKSRNENGLLNAFGRGTLAGIVSLAFLFFLRLGNIAPFPPESALEAFLKVIPASLQESSVQNLGDFAGELGLVIATVIAILVYGIFGIVFDRFYAPRFRTRSLSRIEKFLIYALIPWLFFGLVVFPLSGASLFGVSSGVGSSALSLWVAPVSLLVSSCIFGLFLSWEYSGSAVFSSPKSSAVAIPNGARASESQSVTRRAFVEKGAVAVASLALLVSSFDSLLTSASSGSPSQQVVTTTGGGINLAGAPQIFEDPRLAGLVDAEVTPNNDFYRVAIDIFDPAVDVSSWSLQVGGLVGNPKTYSLSDLQRLPKTEEYNTFECVSNLVNGNLISNAKWGGLRLSDLFADVGGLAQGADYVVFYSVDGYSVGVPVSRATLPVSMVALEMNGSSLPQAHGYPLRAVIPGLYGMMSAKWIRKIQVMNSTYVGYWQTRGWTNNAEVQTLAFITVPRDGAQASLSKYNGSVILGGYAYAGDRGISKVEVSSDEGKTWQPASLKSGLANNTWALWAFDWHPQATGFYSIYARATDGTGAQQTSVSTDNFPNGATGYASIGVNVSQ